jgi:hypothetical protein
VLNPAGAESCQRLYPTGRERARSLAPAFIGARVTFVSATRRTGTVMGLETPPDNARDRARIRSTTIEAVSGRLARVRKCA